MMPDTILTTDKVGAAAGRSARGRRDGQLQNDSTYGSAALSARCSFCSGKARSPDRGGGGGGVGGGGESSNMVLFPPHPWSRRLLEWQRSGQFFGISRQSSIG